MPPPRQPMIAGNWKMNFDLPASVQFTLDLVHALKASSSLSEVVIAPTMLSLAKVADTLDAAYAQQGTTTASSPSIKLAVQDIHWEDDGAFTGKVSVSMLKSLPIPYAIIGHSEQRQYFHETNESIAKKVKKLLAAKIKPILCIGETLAERKAGKLESVLRTQLETVFAGLDKEVLSSLPNKMVIAYEPVWAIGTGVSASSEEAESAHAFVRGLLEDLTGSDEAAAGTRILYGGSVKPKNAQELLACPNIDGALVGGASLVCSDFIAIIDALPRI